MSFELKKREKCFSCGRPFAQNIYDSISALKSALKNDEEYYRTWKANISMAFIDECMRQGYGVKNVDLRKAAEDGADRFLKLLMLD